MIQLTVDWHTVKQVRTHIQEFVPDTTCEHCVLLIYCVLPISIFHILLITSCPQGDLDPLL